MNRQVAKAPSEKYERFLGFLGALAVVMIPFWFKTVQNYPFRFTMVQNGSKRCHFEPS
jgi:hypothetical protein